MRDGSQIYMGIGVSAGDVFPMVITRVWGQPATSLSAVNGQVVLDGNDTYWPTSITEAKASTTSRGRCAHDGAAAPHRGVGPGRGGFPHRIRSGSASGLGVELLMRRGRGRLPARGRRR